MGVPFTSLDGDPEASWGKFSSYCLLSTQRRLVLLNDLTILTILIRNGGNFGSQLNNRTATNIGYVRHWYANSGIVSYPSSPETCFKYFVWARSWIATNCETCPYGKFIASICWRWLFWSAMIEMSSFSEWLASCEASGFSSKTRIIVESASWVSSSRKSRQKFR